MIGRQAHADPWNTLATADVEVFGAGANPKTATSRRALLEAYGAYCDATRGRFGVTKDGYAVPSIRHLVHPLQNLFYGEPNAKRWRRAMDEALKRDAKNPDATVSELIERTLEELPSDADPERVVERVVEREFTEAVAADRGRGHSRLAALRLGKARIVHEGSPPCR